MSFSSFNSFNSLSGIVPSISNAPINLYSSSITTSGFTISFTQPNGSSSINNPSTNFNGTISTTSAVITFSNSSNPSYYVGILEPGNIIAKSSTATLSVSSLTSKTTYNLYVLGFYLNNTTTSVALYSFNTL
jgi:hypothetical protein